MGESLRQLHYKFTGDAKLAQAMKEPESVIRKAAEMNVAPAWSDVGQPIYTAISVTCRYFYAKAATPFSDGGLSRGWDMHDCTSTIDFPFDQLKNKINEATQHNDGSERGLSEKGHSIGGHEGRDQAWGPRMSGPSSTGACLIIIRSRRRSRHSWPTRGPT